jgi:hypothetical protein
MTDTINYATPKPEFDIGRVVNRTFAAIKNNFATFFLASLLIVGLPMFIVGLLPVFMGLNGGMLNGNEINTAYIGGFLVITFVTIIVVLIGSVILQGALIYASIADFNGQRASFGESARIGLRYFFPLLGLGILYGLAKMGGFLLLIVPGILIALGWSIAAPILIVEGKSITESISRSWQLTSGYKRWIFLLWIIISVISAIIGAILGAFTLIAGDPTTVLLEGGSTVFHFTNAVFSALTQAISTMIGAAGVAAVYYELRQIREGIGAESLAAVFD